MSENLITVSLTMPANMLTSVYALLAGSPAAPVAAPVTWVKPSPAPVSVKAETVVAGESPSASIVGSENAPSASTDDGPLDAGGWPWSADMHASTKALTGAGLWRMKPGAARPENKPGFTGSATAPATAPAPVPSPSAAAPVAAPVDDDDEFVAFRNAAGMAATAAPTARTWTDADLSKLCNQAAVRLTPEPVKAIIAEFVPAGEPAHSRSIPVDKREAFAVKVETALGIVYEG